MKRLIGQPVGQFIRWAAPMRGELGGCRSLP
jgi:hypothetical protein